MADRHLTCQEVVELVTDYLEGVLPEDERALFDEHLDLCDGCRWYLDQMRITIETVGRIDEGDVPPELQETLLRAFRAR